MEKLSFRDLRKANVSRCEEVFHPLDDWSPTDWACAMAGEAGEACNKVKKLRRLGPADECAAADIDGVLTVKIAHELADVVIYCDLLAARLDIDLGEAIAEKFNIVSKKVGSSRRL